MIQNQCPHKHTEEYKHLCTECKAIRIEKLKSQRGMFNFEGNNVTQFVGGWQIHGKVFSEPEQVLKLIDDACKSVENAIIRANTVTVDCSSGSNSAINSSGCEI